MQHWERLGEQQQLLVTPFSGVYYTARSVKEKKGRKDGLVSERYAANLNAEEGKEVTSGKTGSQLYGYLFITQKQEYFSGTSEQEHWLQLLYVTTRLSS